jgi:hypothetical protein
MFKFLVSESGSRRDIDLYPQPKTLRESFALWAMRVFAPRLTAVSVSKNVQRLIDSEGAREEWRLRMQEWNSQRLEDVTVLEMSINDTTGELEI